MDVRPAMDSFQNVWDRMVVAYWRIRVDVLGLDLKARRQA
ncbi:unnamed protein product [Soboliphyme baturini]|uniref:MarR family transcriptional regulator n=1 Tax=Soboliphyme baturini TaxID=241478 RepID=A0A183J0J7_9BILA|nr:unnamed protein product [Soboliphyme baturini]